MQPARLLRERIVNRQLVTGIIVTNHAWTELIEVARRAELDYVIIDMEHGSMSLDLVAEVCATGRRLDFPVLLRPVANDYATLRQAIDQGPCGFLLAYVQAPEELDVVRQAIYLPPRGRRRPGGVGNYWVPDFSQGSWQREVEDDFLVLPQIENRRGLENAVAIARHELTSALAVGPYDLSADLGVCGQMQHPELRQALETIRVAAAAAGKAMWMIGSDAAQLVRDGWRFICMGEPTAILEAALRERIIGARQQS
jgi:2-keto-3-deoxy-L-rhamnonate aldolase RhmA